MSFLALMLFLPVLCAACSDGASTQVGLRSGTEARQSSPAAANNTREQLSDAQRARAQSYWLPQNQLPADAPVEHPTPGGAAAGGD